MLLGLLGVLDGEAPDIKVVAEVVDDVDRKVGVGCSRKGETAPQVNVLHVRSKQPLEAKGGKVGVEGSEHEGKEGDVEEREGLMSDMGGDHQADSVSERETNVEDPRDQVLADNIGRGVQPEEGDQRAADIGKDTDKSRCNGQVLVLARLDHMLESGEDVSNEANGTKGDKEVV